MIDKVKEIALKVWPFLLVLLVGVAVGWQVKPTKVEEKTKIVEVEKQIVVEKEVVRVEVVHVKDTQVVERWHREKTEETKPDGTVISREVEDKNIDSLIKEKENTVEVKVVEVEKQIVVEKEVLIEKKPVLPDWHMGLLVGASLRTPVSDTPLMVGIEVERRILGPFFLGAWGMAGSPVVGGFNVTNVTFGIKLGAEF